MSEPAPSPAIDRAAARRLRVLVLTGYGLNWEAETAAGFRALGGQVDLRHVADALADGPDALAPYGLLAFIGGFSFGDHIASGRVLANRLRYRMGDRLQRFVADGGLCLGICNGFQTLVKLGLLPGGEPGLRQSVTLVHNDRLGYWDAWVRLAVGPAGPCGVTRGRGGSPARPTPRPAGCPRGPAARASSRPATARASSCSPTRRSGPRSSRGIRSRCATSTPAARRPSSGPTTRTAPPAARPACATRAAASSA